MARVISCPKCFKSFEPTGNRQKVCFNCGPRAKKAAAVVSCKPAPIPAFAPRPKSATEEAEEFLAQHDRIRTALNTRRSQLLMELEKVEDMLDQFGKVKKAGQPNQFCAKCEIRRVQNLGDICQPCDVEMAVERSRESPEDDAEDDTSTQDEPQQSGLDLQI